MAIKEKTIANDTITIKSDAGVAVGSNIVVSETFSTKDLRGKIITIQPEVVVQLTAQSTTTHLSCLVQLSMDGTKFATYKSSNTAVAVTLTGADKVAVAMLAPTLIGELTDVNAPYLRVVWGAWNGNATDTISAGTIRTYISAGE